MVRTPLGISYFRKSVIRSLLQRELSAENLHSLAAVTTLLFFVNMTQKQEILQRLLATLISA